jgi:predicted  nucleic acid-binding Zn-ribbon protein
MSDLATKEPTLEELRRQREDLQIELDKRNRCVDTLIAKRSSSERNRKLRNLREEIAGLKKQIGPLSKKIHQFENPAPPAPPTLSERLKVTLFLRPRSHTVS